MRKLPLLLVPLLFNLLFAIASNAQDKIELFGGYSYLRPAVSLSQAIVCPVGILPPCPVITTTTHLNLNGWELSGTFYAGRWIGLTADFSGHYGSTQGVSTHLQTYLFGPQVRVPGKVSPFAHVLFGGAHEFLGAAPGLVNSGTTSAFAAAAGAGIDIKVAPFLSFRPIQMDYLLTRFGSSTQSQPRVTAGVLLRF